MAIGCAARIEDPVGVAVYLRTVAFQVAGLARRDVTLDEHEFRFWERLRNWPNLSDLRPLLTVGLKALARLRLSRYRLRSDDARAAGDRCELLKRPLPSTGVRRASAINAPR